MGHHRQLEPMAKGVDVESIKGEIVRKILAGEEEQRLRWIDSGVVQVVLRRIFLDGSAYKRTIESRRRRLREALKKELMGHGWCCENRNVFRKPIEA